MTEKRNIQAVLFDMDGLLFDSERAGLKAIWELCREQGVDIQEEHLRKIMGTSEEKQKGMLAAWYPALDYGKMRGKLLDRLEETAKEGRIPLKKGAMELLRFLEKNRIPCAVASSSPRNIIETYVRKQGIGNFFQALLSGSDFTHSKPHPEIFLEAAKKLRTPIENCLVLEDSVNGVKAGRNSGAVTVMIPDILPYTEELAPYVDQVLEDLSMVIPFLHK